MNRENPWYRWITRWRYGISTHDIDKRGSVLMGCLFVLLMVPGLITIWCIAVAALRRTF